MSVTLKVSLGAQLSPPCLAQQTLRCCHCTDGASGEVGDGQGYGGGGVRHKTEPWVSPSGMEGEGEGMFVVPAVRLALWLGFEALVWGCARGDGFSEHLGMKSHWASHLGGH